MKQSGFLLLAAVFLFSAGRAPAQCCYPESDITGVWRSAKAENLKNGNFMMRVYEFDRKTFKSSFMQFSDRSLKKPLFTFQAEGTYTVNEASNKAEGAQNAAFRFTRKTLLLQTSNKNIIQRLGFADCGLTRGAAKDISETGCASFRPIEEYRVEYDLARRSGNMLYLGLRPDDGNMGSEDKRPVTLGEPLVKDDSK